MLRHEDRTCTALSSRDRESWRPAAQSSCNSRIPNDNSISNAGLKPRHACIDELIVGSVKTASVLSVSGSRSKSSEACAALPRLRRHELDACKPSGVDNRRYVLGTATCNDTSAWRDKCQLRLLRNGCAHCRYFANHHSHSSRHGVVSNLF
jgi:hypothetical protein